MLTKDRLLVLGLMKNQEVYAGDPKMTEVKVLQSPGALEEELAKDAVAVYQVADDLYIHQRYRIEP